MSIPFRGRLAFPSTIPSVACALVLALAAALPVLADHGPGTSGGGSAVQSAETLKPGKVSFGLRWDFTKYEKLSEAEIRRKAAQVDDDHAHLDALRYSSLVTAELSYGVTEGLHLSLSTGWYRGDDLREGHVHGDGSVGFHEYGDVTGMTDLWISGKYRFLKGPYGALAALAGIKLPTGRDDVRGDGEDEPLEASLQPGSGAFDFQVGAAYSIWLTERITLDASGAWIFRTTDDGFKIGDRFDGGVAAAWRLMEDAASWPQVSFFAELLVRYILENEEDGEEVKNSGGTVLFLSPGARLGFNEHVSLSVAPRFPVLQDLNDEQQETLFQVAGELVFSF